MTALITFFATKSFIKPEVLPPVPGRIDTVWRKADTVSISNPLSAKIQAKLDTVEIMDSIGNVIQDVIASADTMIRKDSSYIKVVYHFPPENYFDVYADIKEKIITVTRNILKYVPVPQPWYDHFWVGAASTAAAIIAITITIIKFI